LPEIKHFGPPKIFGQATLLSSNPGLVKWYKSLLAWKAE